MAELIERIKNQAAKGLWLLEILDDVIHGPSLKDVQPKHNSFFQLNAISLICIVIVGYFLYILQEMIQVILKR